MIIIGYGCKDDGINSIVKESFDYKNKPAFIVDNHASDCVKDFANSISAKLIECGIENINSQTWRNVIPTRPAYK